MSAELQSGESGSFKLSCGIGTVEELENLVRGTLGPAQAAQIAAHADCCAVCAKELAWLRAEKELFAQRARGVPPSQVWSQVEAQLSQRLVAQLGPGRARSRFWDRLRGQNLQWLAVGAAAAMLSIVAVSPLSPLRLRDSMSSWLGQSHLSRATSDGGRAAMVAQSEDEEKEDGEADEPSIPAVSARAPVSGVATVGLDTGSADVQVAVGPAGEVQITTTDSHVRALRLVDKGKGRLQAEFDGHSQLGTGQVRLTLPPGSSVQIRTASGDVQIAGVHGDAEVTTASGDLHIDGARKVTVTTASGEAVVEHASGPVTVTTASGDLTLLGDVVAPVKYSSSSGDLQIAGACRAGCQVSATTTSGDVTMRSDNASAAVRVRSRSGEVGGADGLAVDMRRRPGDKSEWTVHLGRSEGRVELDSDSGGLNLHSGQ